tara:strand:- start:5284 stop:6138 length:855 start_codon:yes stop_codon:yes gene_type:complete
MRIGFLGLGEMGANIALRLLDCGYSIYATKRGNYECCENKKNFFLYDSPREISELVECFILCIDTVENLKEILYSKDGILKSKNKPSFIFDLSTGLPSVVKKNYEDLKKVGVSYVDAPIGRTPEHALEGKLNLFVSCKKTELDKSQIKILEIISENRFYFDEISEGTKLKLLNNFFGQCITLIFGKTLLANNKNFQSINNLSKIMSAGPLHAPILDAIKPHFEKMNQGSMQFSIKNALKDLKYFREDLLSEKDELTEFVINKFEKAVKDGFGNESVAEVAKYVD